MRCAEEISVIWQTGHSDETHSPDECARIRGIAEGAVRLTREGRPDGGSQRFLRIGQLHLGFGKGSRNGSDGITGAVHGSRPP